MSISRAVVVPIRLHLLQNGLKGIQFLTVNEAYTSKCSFLDNELIGHHDKYLGKRIHRGLFRTSNGRFLNAGVNGAFNIMKKAFPNSVSVDGIEAFGLMPQILQQNIVDNSICNKMSTV